MANEIIDWHVHSTASDGSYSSEELVEKRIKEEGINLAIIDHDTTKGLAPAYSKAEELGFTSLGVSCALKAGFFWLNDNNYVCCAGHEELAYFNAKSEDERMYTDMFPDYEFQ